MAKITVAEVLDFETAYVLKLEDVVVQKVETKIEVAIEL